MYTMSTLPAVAAVRPNQAPLDRLHRILVAVHLPALHIHSIVCTSLLSTHLPRRQSFICTAGPRPYKVRVAVSKAHVAQQRPKVWAILALVSQLTALEALDRRVAVVLCVAHLLAYWALHDVRKVPRLTLKAPVLRALHTRASLDPCTCCSSSTRSCHHSSLRPSFASSSCSASDFPASNAALTASVSGRSACGLAGASIV